MTAERIALKFKRVQSQGLGGIVVHYQQEGSNRPFTIQASKYGVRICSESPVIDHEEDLQEFARTMARAWQEHKRIASSTIVTE